MKLVQALALAALAFLFFSPPAQPVDFISIGTGGVTGAYYPTGGAICRLLNRSRKEHGIRCSVQSTGGSVYNLNSIRKGDLDFGVAQSDSQHDAYFGTGRFSDGGPYKELRSVFAVHPEPVTLLTRRDSGVRHIRELRGKRISIGNPGSGTRQIWHQIEEAMNWNSNDFAATFGIRTSQAGGALCAGKMDAFPITTGHPSKTVKEVTSACDVVIAEVSGPEIDRLVEANRYFRHAIIPGGLYAGNREDVRTFGVGATLVTSAAVPDRVVYHLVKAVFERFNEFRKLHPAFAGLEIQEMIRDSLSAPLHPGAEQYYRERGWNVDG